MSLALCARLALRSPLGPSAVFSNDKSVGDVFEHADVQMYENKKKLKKK